jgi:hypothetical protein
MYDAGDGFETWVPGNALPFGATGWVFDPPEEGEVYVCVDPFQEDLFGETLLLWGSSPEALAQLCEERRQNI